MVKPSEVLFVTDEVSIFLFRDLCDIPGMNSYIFHNPSNLLVNLIKRIHVNPKIGKYLWLPKRDIWYNKRFIIENIPKNGYLMINSSVMTNLTMGFWKKLKKYRPDVKFVLILVDSMNVTGGHMVETKKRIIQMDWDYILSYDRYDCKRYGFIYIGFDYYSPAKINNKRIDYDLYYVASIKSGRGGILRKINNVCKEKNINNLFQIVSSWRNVDYGKCIRHNIPYENILNNIFKSNCILEILQDGQEVQTIRYLEAVCYKKKLLTNNHHIKDYPYYNGKYMKCFNNVDEIDWDWVKKVEDVYYGNYNFSSANLLRYIQ